MAKILLLTVLLVFVYQFDELVKGLHFALARIRHKKYRELFLDSDYYVGTALALAGMPMALNFLLISNLPLTGKLFIIALAFITFGLAAVLAGMFKRRMHYPARYQSIKGYVLLTYSLVSMFQPILRTLPWHGGRASSSFKKLAFLLSLPVLLGYGFKLYFDQNSFEAEYMRYLDALIVVMVGGAFISIIISFMEKFFRTARLNLLSYVRILTGLAVTAALFL